MSARQGKQAQVPFIRFAPAALILYGRCNLVKVCIYCARPYHAVRSDQKFCSVSCRIRYVYGKKKKPETRTCQYCGDTYTTIKDNQKYCSTACHDAAHNKKQYKKKRCAYCGELFWTSTAKKEYCSQGCSISAKRERDKGRPR